MNTFTCTRTYAILMAAVGDRGVHVSAQDGGGGLAKERREHDGSEEAAAGLLPKRGMFRFGNY